MKRLLLALPVAALVATATPATASACDPGMPTCGGIENWIDERVWTLEYYVIDPTLRKVQEIDDSVECQPDIC